MSLTITNEDISCLRMAHIYIKISNTERLLLLKSTSYYRKTIQNLGIFLFLVVMLAILIIPSYSMLFSSARDDIIEEYNSKLQQQIKMMENEINLQKSVLKEMAEEQAFKTLANPDIVGHTVNSVEWFESRENVKKSFSMLKPMVFLQDKSLLMFRNGDLQIDINGAESIFRTNYDSLWNLTANGQICSIDAAMAHLFMKKHEGKIDGVLHYNDTENEQTYELIYALTLFSSDDGVSDSVFLICYDAEKLMERLGLLDDATSILMTTSDNKKVFGFGNEYDASVYDSGYQSDSLGLRVHYSISDNAVKAKLEPVNFFLFIFALGFVLLGLIATVGISVVETRHIKKLVSVAKGTTDVEYEIEDDYLKYLETIFRNLYDKANKESDRARDLIFSKILHFKPSAEELQTVSKYFNSPVYVVLLKGREMKSRSFEQHIHIYLKKEKLDIIHIAGIGISEVLLFVKKSSSVRETLEDIIVNINKEHQLDIRGILAACDNIEEMPEIYEKIRKTIPYLEYGSLKSVELNSYEDVDEDFKAFMAKGRQLYEIIKSGNEFEAKRMVYEQWYKITQGETDTSAVEPLFFSQSTVLSQIASDYKLNIVVPHFDSGKDAVSIAFEITGCIEQICEMMNGNIKKEDVRSNQIIDYIEQRYSDSSFYMPELVGKFEMSDRAIVQILKKATGDNFSNYLSKLRISKAKDLLSTTNMPVAEVATSSGFDSSNSLYKAFKKICGVSPSVYRENRKTDKE